MPLTLSDIPDLVLPGLRAEFHDAFRTAGDGSVADRLATVISTTSPSQRYAFLGAAPGMREFLDERRPSTPSAHAVTIEDKVFEATLAVDRRALEDDALDLIRTRVRELASRVAIHRSQMVVGTLVGGTTGAGYDGRPLFDASHPAGDGGTWSNVSGEDFGSEALAGAISQMMSVPDDDGVPLGIAPDTLLVGPDLQWAASEIAESPVVVHKGEGTRTDYRNALQGRLRLVVSPFVPGDKWFVLDTSRPMRAVVLQQRSDVPVEFTALEAGSGSEAAFLRDRYYYGVRARYNVGVGLWQTAMAGGF